MYFSIWKKNIEIEIQIYEKQFESRFAKNKEIFFIFMFANFPVRTLPICDPGCFAAGNSSRSGACSGSWLLLWFLFLEQGDPPEPFDETGISTMQGVWLWPPQVFLRIQGLPVLPPQPDRLIVVVILKEVTYLVLPFLEKLIIKKIEKIDKMFFLKTEWIFRSSALKSINKNTIGYPQKHHNF